MNATPTAPDATAMAFTIDQAVRASGLSRATIYRLAGQGRIRPRKLGRRTLILASELRDLLQALPAAPIRPQRDAG